MPASSPIGSRLVVRSGDVALAATRRGSGPALVLLHSLAMSAQLWDPFVDTLAEQFEVWTYDARGHGASTGGGQPFSIEDMVGDLATLLDTAGHAQASVLGLSMGGSVATVFAARYPERVTRLVLADTTACYGSTRVKDWEERAAKATTQAREDQIAFQLERWLSPAFRTEHPEEVERLQRIFVACDSAAHAHACHALGALDAVAELSAIEAPTLVLVGESDYATPISMAQELAHNIPGSTLQIIPNARHLALIEKPSIWSDIEAFLEGK